MRDHELMQRLATLEGQVRRSRIVYRALAPAVLLAVCALLMGQHAAQTVSAERFVLQDAQGSPRGIWEVHGEQASLRLIDPAGNNRLHLSVDAEGVPSVAVLGPDGRQVRGVFGLSESGAAAVFLQDTADTKRVGLTVSKTGVPAIALNDNEGNPRVALGVADNGVAFVALKDAEGTLKNFLYIGQDGAGGLNIKDADGKLVSKLP